MRYRVLIPLIAVGCLVPPFLFVLFFIDGAGAVRVDLEYTPDGRIRHQLTEFGIGTTMKVYWTENNVFDASRSGRFRWGIRTRGLSAEEIRDVTVGPDRLNWDLNSMLLATHEFARGPDGFTTSSQSELEALANRKVAPASFAQVVGYDRSRALLHGSNSAFKDPWGHEYELRAEPTSSCFADAKRITIFTRGSDGLPGGDGLAADHGVQLDSDGMHTVDEIP